MDHRDELQTLRHQLELANRAIPLISDQATVERLETFANEIKGKLDELQAAAVREDTRRRAFVLWQEAGRPDGHDLEFWLRAEQGLGRARTLRSGEQVRAIRGEWRDGRETSSWEPRSSRRPESKGQPFDGYWRARSLPPSPPAPKGDAVPCREVGTAPIHEENIRPRAYKLWEEAGRPEGRMDEFWHEARHQLDATRENLR